MTWFMLGAGLILLITGAELLVKGASRLAISFGIPALVVGLTVVAFGTSAPEMAVSVKAAFSGQAELAIANVVGSNIFNILFILGLAAVIMPLIVSQQLIRQDVPIMIAISVMALWMIQDGMIGKLEATILFAGVVLYTVFLFYQGKKTGIDNSEVDEKPAPTWLNVMLIIIGLALLVLGARWLVQSAVTIASSFGVSEAVIGLTIIAAGTSLPEVMTSIVATIKGERDIAIGNVVGSNIFNILAVLGLSGLFSPTPLLASEQLMQIDVPVMLGVAILCLPLFFLGGILNRFEGLLFLMLYVAYVWFTIAMALSLPYLPQLQTWLLYGLAPVVVFYVFLCLINDLLRRRYR
ncbi:calcium/sodium antiporter [Methylophaga pinxianii]|uniref:calcium/sodium antiporter n=1 Tax=Methylophaga pinxianii TaxID=2881052 RepID=UPI001CF5D6E6|nr:calcium/sodium antiporter [Methylophaga pinxianii]MCB2427583.1 calcium/sodium antiporter [Methylophaga pinxianii]UPH44585.1 calcium/sodium antiporter [Methylophaga pinxianii]